MTPTDAWLDRPPFQAIEGMDASAIAEAIVASFSFFCGQPKFISVTFETIARFLGLPVMDPLRIAGVEIAATMDRGIGVLPSGHYHGAQHCCEIMLCSLYVAQLANLSLREQVQVIFAALVHDFHHDAQPNGTQLFRLELHAISMIGPYLLRAGVNDRECARIGALILATEPTTGVVFAQRCYTQHLHTPRIIIDAPRTELALLARDPRATLQALVLSEADVLPSVALTYEHACRVQSRFATELDRHLGPQDKIHFIDQINEFLVAMCFSPTRQKIRQANVDILD